MKPEPVQTTNNQYTRAEADILAHIETKLGDIDDAREKSRSRNSFFAGATFSLSSILRELRRGAAREAVESDSSMAAEVAALVDIIESECGTQPEVQRPALSVLQGGITR